MKSLIPANEPVTTQVLPKPPIVQVVLSTDIVAPRGASKDYLF